MAIYEPIRRYTPVEYLEIERRAEARNEYLDGRIYAMSDGSASHALLPMNLAFEIKARLKNT